jgi:hypothetical protein
MIFRGNVIISLKIYICLDFLSCTLNYVNATFQNTTLTRFSVNFGCINSIFFIASQSADYKRIFLIKEKEEAQCNKDAFDVTV